jgi:glyoxylase-like metal-dependent hydrolase (beta-lactamase superfamily II)
VELESEEYGAVTVLYGERRGKYPHGNSLLVRGNAETAVIDPSLGLIPRREQLPKVDRVINSHCHEDHIAGNFLFPDIPWHLHEADAPGIRSLDALLAIYGMPESTNVPFRKVLVDDFHFTPREDPVAYRDGDVFDLGGVVARVIHTPGLTRGHCALRVESGGDDLLYLGDIDLTSFGPYYGDAWSSLEEFEATLEKVKRLEARWYATFHQIGVVERDEFIERLERFSAVIQRREERLLEFIAEPRSMDEIVAHRIVYRPGDPVFYADAVERRSSEQHLERLCAHGRVIRLEGERFQRA